MSPPASSYVSKNPQKQSMEQHYSWEPSSSFVRSFYVEINKENISCDIQKHPLQDIHFSAERKGEKTTRPEVTFLPEAHRRVSGCGKTCSLGSDPVFARTKPDFGFWAGECQELGQNFLSQAELCDSVCSGTLPVYLYELAAVFHCAGPSPGESLSERNLSKL